MSIPVAEISIPVVEISAILSIIKNGVEWAQRQKELGNISQEDFDAIFERIDIKKDEWDNLAPKDIED